MAQYSPKLAGYVRGEGSEPAPFDDRTRAAILTAWRRTTPECGGHTELEEDDYSALGQIVGIYRTAELSGFAASRASDVLKDLRRAEELAASLLEVLQSGPFAVEIDAAFYASDAGEVRRLTDALSAFRFGCSPACEYLNAEMSDGGQHAPGATFSFFIGALADFFLSHGRAATAPRQNARSRNPSPFAEMASTLIYFAGINPSSQSDSALRDRISRSVAEWKRRRETRKKMAD